MLRINRVNHHLEKRLKQELRDLQEHCKLLHIKNKLQGKAIIHTHSEKLELWNI